MPIVDSRAPVLSVRATLVFALLWAALLARESGFEPGEPALAGLADPVAVADRLATRDLALADAIATAPAWERGFLENTFGDRGENLEYAIEVHAELARALEGSGRAEELAAVERTLRQLRAVDPKESVAHPQLALLRRAEALYVANTALLLLGALALALGGLRSSHGPGCAAAVPWAWQDGLGVWIRAEFYAALYFHALWFVDSATASVAFAAPLIELLYGWATLFASLPLVWLIRRHLLDGSFTAAPLGLDPRALGLVRLLGFTGAAIGLDFGGTFLIETLASVADQPGVWSEGISEALLFGTRSELALEISDLVLWAPAFEELAFRAVLYQSLRSRLGPGPATVLSATAFASVHFYGVAGFAATFWSGLVWAVVFERARSLWPGFLSHATYNALYVFGQAAIYRA